MIEFTKTCDRGTLTCECKVFITIVVLVKASGKIYDEEWDGSCERCKR
ncbi:hypothetical protein JQ710_09460 [Francisella tularensis subsp. holarctica]|nr:hypothetical protein [Francisella tularensis subsp. holarctica]